ncbi:ferredoxin--NADP+ reductase [Methylopila capsulata]|uniref:Ferredoxin--NADP+ reductase n=1 Tax=Methylopila capsulata TaxID=61654 RepID=A0A9W6ITT0_9HYPH|nr:FAD-dependent oxidoreductase [Methylopila capsulata]MBM7852182.1 ferredoxin--NADP+ reductase [Methylopila capsulata]GLK56388.1 NADP oxidoreductase [Methylopila capsulata]
MSGSLTPMRPQPSEATFRVAVVGGGPSGFYAAEGLLRSALPIAVDMFDRLPTPFGLVRSGVAPDHPKLKQVAAVFDRIAHTPGFRYVGGVAIGEDVPLETLRASYHAVILATGAMVDRRMGVPGEGLAGSRSAGEFVGWYNGHPDYSHLRFDLSSERAVVVGHGNVALDVARILLKTADELRHTDIAEHALGALAESRIREVHVVGRRGPCETRFSPKELHEFSDLTSCEPALDEDDLAPHSFASPANAGPDTRAALGMLEAFARGPRTKPRRCVFRFHLDPIAIEGDGRVERAMFRRTRCGEGDAGAELVAIECGLLFSSIGRRSAPLAGAPYDEARGVHANIEGRVVAASAVVPGLYVCGWSKRGPEGTIGANRACSAGTVERVLADLASLAAPPLAAERLIAGAAPRSGSVVDYAAWKRIDAAEVERGRRAGKPREKFVTIGEMIDVGGRRADACCR